MSGDRAIEFPCLVIQNTGYIYVCTTAPWLSEASRELVHQYINGQLVDASGGLFDITAVRIIGPAPGPLLKRLAGFMLGDRRCSVEADIEARGHVDVEQVRALIDQALATAIKIERLSKRKYYGDDEAFSEVNQIKRIQKRVKTAASLQELLRRIVKMQS